MPNKVIAPVSALREAILLNVRGVYCENTHRISTIRINEHQEQKRKEHSDKIKGI